MSFIFFIPSKQQSIASEMLGSLQPNLLLSPASNKQQLNLNPNIKISSTNSLQQSSGLDDKSLKDIIEILNRRIENVKYLNEFSQVLQVDNISKLN